MTDTFITTRKRRSTMSVAITGIKEVTTRSRRRRPRPPNNSPHRSLFVENPQWISCRILWPNAKVLPTISLSKWMSTEVTRIRDRRRKRASSVHIDSINCLFIISRLKINTNRDKDVRAIFHSRTNESSHVWQWLNDKVLSAHLQELISHFCFVHAALLEFNDIGIVRLPVIKRRRGGVDWRTLILSGCCWRMLRVLKDSVDTGWVSWPCCLCLSAMTRPFSPVSWKSIRDDFCFSPRPCQMHLSNGGVEWETERCSIRSDVNSTHHWQSFRRAPSTAEWFARKLLIYPCLSDQSLDPSSSFAIAKWDQFSQATVIWSLDGRTSLKHYLCCQKQIKRHATTKKDISTRRKILTVQIGRWRAAAECGANNSWVIDTGE